MDDRWLVGWMDGWMNGWLVCWMEGWIDDCVGEHQVWLNLVLGLGKAQMDQQSQRNRLFSVPVMSLSPCFFCSYN